MQNASIVGVFSKPAIPHAPTLVPELLQWLETRGILVLCDELTAKYAGRKDPISRERIPDTAQLVIVLGGDGTLLAAARALAGREIPIFPVNLGGLGFLTAIRVDQLYPELERALNGEQRVIPRRMLHADLMRGSELIASYEALNDVVLAKSNIARMIDIEVRVDEHYMSYYKADGLILCTPTGSTAYSLSAGGPIIHPDVAALCLTPICPHMLTNRPVLLPHTSTVEVTSRAADYNAFLTIDGQVGEPVLKNDQIICRSSAHRVLLIRAPKMLFFDVLREKLKWGQR